MVSQPELHPVWSSAELKGSSRSTRSVPARVRKSSVCLSALSVIRQTEDFETAPRTLDATTVSGDPSLCLEEPARRRRMCDLTVVASSPTVVRQPAYARSAPYLEEPGSYSSAVTSRSSPHWVLPPGLKATWIM